jgi:peroxiredoxin
MHRITPHPAVMLGIVLVGGLALRASSQTTPAPTGAMPTATIGKPAPNFILTGPNGRSVSLDRARQGQKATVLMFISTQCPVSNSYNERMIQVAKDYAGKKVCFLGINANRAESVEEVAKHAKSHHFPFPVLIDVGNAVADAYDAQVTPHVYVIDDEGVLRYRGRIDDSQNPDGIKSRDLRAALDAVLAGRPVAVAETRAFGCSIQRMPKENGS